MNSSHVALAWDRATNALITVVATMRLEANAVPIHNVSPIGCVAMEEHLGTALDQHGAEPQLGLFCSFKP